MSENPDVLYVPVSAVFVDDLDRTVVYVRDGETVRSQPVELGGSTERVAIVRSGIEEGDQVLLVPPEAR